MRSEDGRIIRECLNGDSASFGLLVDKYKASIYALAYSRLHNFHDAEDVVQDVFLKAYKNLRTLKRWDSFLVWLRSMTINRCKDKIRDESRRPDKEFIEDHKSKELEETPDRDDESIISHQQVMDYLDSALKSLPEIYQQVLTLHYLGGMRGEEISQFLGVSHITVRQRLSRARNLLREEVLTMMGATYEQERLQASFTFRIVEAVKRIKIHPVSDTKSIPMGLSMAAGIILTILSINPHFTIPEYVGIPINSPLPSETKVLKTGEIPVDVVKTFKMPIMASQQDNGKGGEKLPKLQNAVLLAPHGEEDTWTRKADMPTAKYFLSTSVVDRKIYAIGGWDANWVCLKTVDEYDPVKDTWTKKADMPTARFMLSTSVVDRKVYAIGGGSIDVIGFSTVEAYDPATDTWTKCSDMSTGRRGLSTNVVNGKIYAIGGADSFGPSLSIVEEYDPLKDIWTKKADMPTARNSLSTCVVNDEIYAIGGISVNTAKSNALSTVEIYNPAMDRWTKKADMPTARAGLSTSLVNGKIYAIGGGGPVVVPGAVLSKVEVYDPDTDKWTEKTDILTAREGLSTSVVGEKIYAIGGLAADDVILTTVEEYIPEGWPFSILPQGKLPTKWGTEKKR